MEDVQVGGIAGEEVPPGVQLGTQRKLRVGKRNVGIRFIEDDICTYSFLSGFVSFSYSV